MTWWRAAGGFGFLAVALGAFGAHALRDIVAPEAMSTWHTASQYHLAHALALGLVAAHPRQPRVAGIAFSIGIVLFSGSLYLLTVTGVRWLGAITPLGGVAFLTGWLALALASRKVHKTS